MYSVLMKHNYLETTICEEFQRLTHSTLFPEYITSLVALSSFSDVLKNICRSHVCVKTVLKVTYPTLCFAIEIVNVTL